jgi:hypothetical protein
VDLGGSESGIVDECAELGVPSIGLRTTPGQAALWPDLSLAEADVDTAARMARQVLTDHAHAAGLVRRAGERRVRPEPRIPIGAMV